MLLLTHWARWELGLCWLKVAVTSKWRMATKSRFLLYVNAGLTQLIPSAYEHSRRHQCEVQYDGPAHLLLIESISLFIHCYNPIRLDVTVAKFRRFNFRVFRVCCPVASWRMRSSSTFCVSYFTLKMSHLYTSLLLLWLEKDATAVSRHLCIYSFHICVYSCLNDVLYLSTVAPPVTFSSLL